MAKKMFVFLFVIVSLLLFSSAAFGNPNDYWISIGNSPKNFLSLSAGMRVSQVGFEVGAIYNNESTPPDLLDYPCPHDFNTYIGDIRKNCIFGIDALYFIDLSDGFSIYAGGGLYSDDHITVVRSDITGKYYTQSKSTTFEIAYSGGIKFNISKQFQIGVGYHSVRGYNLQIQSNF